MRFKISEALKHERVKEDFKKLSVEEIAQKYNCSQSIAESLYEDAHNIDMEKVTIEQLFQEMDECWK